MRRFLGIDLAWAEGTTARPARETGLACIDASGRVLDLATVRGIDAVVAWVDAWGGPGAVAAVDGPLVVANATGSRLAEKEVASRYGRLGISAYPSNQGLPAQGAVALRRRLEEAGWEYDDGSGAARDDDARTMVECYPYTTLVGAPELGFDGMKPRYKRLAPLLATADRRPHRAAEFRLVLDAVAGLAHADPPLDVTTHPRAAALVADGPALVEREHKHLEDLLDGLVCAWTASYWARHGTARSQVLGADRPRGRRARAPRHDHRAGPAAPARARGSAARPLRLSGDGAHRGPAAQPRRSPKRSWSTRSRFFTSVSLGIFDSPSVRSMNTIATSVGRRASRSARCFISIWKP